MNTQTLIATIKNRVDGSTYDTTPVVVYFADGETAEQALQRNATCGYNDMGGDCDRMDPALCEVFWHDLIAVRIAA